MPIENVLCAVTEVELRTAWDSWLTHFISENEVFGFCVRWVLSDSPRLTRSLALGPQGDFVQKVLKEHRRLPLHCAEVPVAHGGVPTAAVELSDVPAAVALGSEYGAAAVEALKEVCGKRAFISALGHSFQVLQMHMSANKAVVLKSTEATLILDGHGVVHGRNDAAVHVFDNSREVLRYGEDHRLKFVGRQDDARFHKALGEVFEETGPARRRLLFDQDLVMVLTGPSKGWVGSDRLVGATLRKLSVPIEVDPQEVMRLLQVSPLQARLAQALLRGETIIEHAVAIGSSESTVRWHLARLMDSLGCRKQSDVVLKLSRMFG